MTNTKDMLKNKPLCDRCGRVLVPVYCHGHTQCAACGQIQVGGDCCQGSQQKQSDPDDGE
jgi:hypothetical protein